MFTSIITSLIALLKAIPAIAELFEKLSKKRTDADVAAHKDTKQMDDDAAVDAAVVARGLQTPAPKPGEQQKNPNDIFPGVD